MPCYHVIVALGGGGGAQRARVVEGLFSLMRASSLEEQVRRTIENELDMPMRPPTHVASSSFLSSPHRRHRHRRDAWALDSGESDSDDDVQPLYSPGHHRVFLATPNRRSHTQRPFARPPLSERAHAHLNISRLAGDATDAWDEKAGTPSYLYARRPSPVPRPPVPGSRHSSSETVVNHDDDKAPGLEAQWADRQLEALTQCIHHMDKELQKIQKQGLSDDLSRVYARLDALEASVAQHSVLLSDLTAKPPPASPPKHASSVDAAMQKMYAELRRLSRAIKDMHARPAPEPPLTPPHMSPPVSAPISEPPASVDTRYEKICQSVADALGVSTRKEKIHANLRQREADDAATESLLRRLQHTKSPLLSMTEVRMLEHLYDQHTREFEHQKQLYCELADELKCMEPMMDSTKRRILAEHVHASIDSLEAEATRINGLHAHLVRHGRTVPFS